ncbi:MAG: hypothetical protein M0017_00835 [Desulfobacteraceae bacterium]|nr:hypothetical protein [Desulfobacteraceae bacterium]
MKTFHELLLESKSAAAAEQKALRFFARNLLARYEEVRIIPEASRPGSDPDFWGQLTAALDENRHRAGELIEELGEAGLSSFGQLRDLPQGYESKALHTLAHLLDGFFGVDSYFYNLVDDSHWVPEPRQRLIRKDPDDYWLLRVAARTGPGGENPFAALRVQAKNL